MPAATMHMLNKLQHPTVPPLVFRDSMGADAARSSVETQSDYAYSASLPDSTPPPPAAVSFERDDRPHRPKALPRHSPLPAARATTPTLAAYHFEVGDPHHHYHQQHAAAILTHAHTDKSSMYAISYNNAYNKNSNNVDDNNNFEKTLPLQPITSVAALPHGGLPTMQLSASAQHHRISAISFTDSDPSTEKSTISTQASSLSFGVFMGLFPPLILCRMLLTSCFPSLDNPSTRNHRYYVYGRSIGLLILVIVIIVIVTVVNYRRNG